MNSPISHIQPAKPTPKWVLEKKSPEPAVAKELDEFQEYVANHRHGALLVLAGPGTGKTATLTEAVVRIINEGEIQASEILVLTFARKAAEEIRDRIVARVGSGKLPAVSTLHALALSIVREFSPPSAVTSHSELKLMSAPEQELAVRELIRGSIEDSERFNKEIWPKSLEEAIKTKGMAIEIRNAMARARSLGLSPKEVAELAGSDPAWSALALFMQDYLDNLKTKAEIDYNELIFAALETTNEYEVKTILQKRYKVIVVDEYQDTDPLQIKILQNIVAKEACLIAVGDPDQSIYGFRGADSRAILNFNQDFAYVDAFQPPIEKTLKVTRRFGRNIADCAQRLIERNGYEVVPGKNKVEHRKLNSIKEQHGEISIRHFETAEAEAESVAESIRALVATRNLQWSDVAVLVRAGNVSIPILERALNRAGIPVDVVFDELPIAQEPIVKVLLTSLEVSENFGMLQENPSLASFLLTSGLGGLSTADLRHLGRLFRDVTRGKRESDWSENLIAKSLSEQQLTSLVDPDIGGTALRKLVKLRELLNKANELVHKNKSVAEVIWYIWNHSSWKDSLRTRALSNEVGSSQAGHDLDSVITLMQLANAHSRDAGIARSIRSFVAEVRQLVVPAQPTLRAFQPNAVSLMTAHRAKGLEWPAVFICTADEDAWPDIRRRNSILSPDRLSMEDISKFVERHKIVQEERRLFYVAATRAKEFLFISSTAADKEKGKLPSRFIGEMFEKNNNTKNGELEEVVQAFELKNEPRYSTQGLIAQLRRISSTDESISQELRDAAESRLAYLARLKTNKNELFVPSANPLAWWGVAERTENSIHIDDPEMPVYVRGSSLQKIHDCSLAWFMQDRAFAQESTSTAMNFGSIIHALAEAVITKELEPDLKEITKEILKVWDKVKYATDWESEVEKQNAVDCIARFLHWHANSGRESKATEIDFDENFVISGPDGKKETFRLKGQIDIVQVSSSGGAYIADLKTVKYAPTLAAAEKNMQLALYQYAVMNGLVHSDDLVALGKNPKTEGAALVCLRIAAGKNLSGPMLRTQKALKPDSPWIEEKLLDAAEIVRAERYLPTISDQCNWCSIRTSCPLQPEGLQVIE